MIHIYIIIILIQITLLLYYIDMRFNYINDNLASIESTIDENMVIDRVNKEIEKRN